MCLNMFCDLIKVFVVFQGLGKDLCFSCKSGEAFIYVSVVGKVFIDV